MSYFGNIAWLNDNRDLLNEKLLLNITFDIVCKVSSNKIYSGIHHTERTKHKNMYLIEILRVIRKNNIKPIALSDYPIKLKFSFMFNRKPLDSSNCSYIAKMAEDCLVSYKILAGDDISHVSEVSMRSIKLVGRDIVNLLIEKTITNAE